MIVPPELWAVLVFAGQMSDAYTTRVALTHYGNQLEEGNGLMQRVLNKFGFKGMQILKALVGGAVLSVVGLAIDNETIWLALTAVSFFPAVWNVSMMAKKEKES